jgi:hypothetical protein
VSQNRELIYGPGGAAGQISQVKDKSPSTNAKPERIPTDLTNFSQPKNFPECNIYKVLQD